MSCKKEKNEKTRDLQLFAPEYIQENEKLAKKGEIACLLELNDTVSCAGKRCGSPTGHCGWFYTACKCVTAQLGFLPDGMSIDQFNELWQSGEGQNYLRGLGYSSRDIK